MQEQFDNMKADFDAKIERLTASVNASNAEKKEQKEGKSHDDDAQEVVDDLQTRKRIK